MIDNTKRILALEARLDDVQASLMAHDILLRSLLAHLAVSEPEAFKQIAARVGGLKAYREGGGGGDLPREVAEEVSEILNEITRSLAARR